MTDGAEQPHNSMSDQFASSASVPALEPAPEPSAPVHRHSALDESHKWLWQPVLDAKGGGSICNGMMWEGLDKVTPCFGHDLARLS
jgi:hypothetical protein